MTSATKSTVTFKIFPILLWSLIFAEFSPIKVISAKWPLLFLSFSASLNCLYIFSLNKEAFKLIDSINLIKSYDVKKIYPNQLKVYLEPAKAISIVEHLDKLVILGNNGKIIDLDKIPINVPKVIGTGDIKKVFQTLKNHCSNFEEYVSNFEK